MTLYTETDMWLVLVMQDGVPPDICLSNVSPCPLSWCPLHRSYSQCVVFETDDIPHPATLFPSR